MKRFGERLKEQRKAAGFTQADLAEKLNIQTVSKWERGISEPDISQLGELAQALGVTLEKLCGQQESGETYVGKFQAERFGKMLGEQRASCGESQEQLAAALAVSTDAISRWERGITCPDIEQLSLLAEHFGLPVSRLYCGIETEEEAEEKVQKEKTVDDLARTTFFLLVARGGRERLCRRDCGRRVLAFRRGRGRNPGPSGYVHRLSGRAGGECDGERLVRSAGSGAGGVRVYRLGG